MKFHSTNQITKNVSLKQAILEGLAEDGGLFMPEKIPALPKEFFEKINTLTLQDIAFEITRAFLSDDLNSEEIKNIISASINFPAPLKKLKDQVYSLELFHGPTLAFKDFGARFMAQLIFHLYQSHNRKITILAATSGDTGSAVGSGFLGLPGFEVIILYPSQKISEIQEKQLTTFGQNVIALEIEGTFDDCQRLVKTAFQDEELKNRILLSSANSINIARLIPQTFYYFYAFAQMQQTKDLIFSIPTGNLGNLTAGIIAKKMGLPVKKFIAAQNNNNSFYKYLETGKFTPQNSILTISNAMDVGNPSNFARTLYLYNHDLIEIRKDISAYAIRDEETAKTITETYQKTGYILDPHGAVGIAALENYLENHGEKTDQGIFFETAHPAKFAEVVEKNIGKKLVLPDSLKKCLAKEKNSTRVSKNYEDFKALLLTLN